eukprot:CAMPEP_0202979478 /NCGR_PEP_ID=MMETSP1396-20130829/85609_1 /ASSEMBLY_ACC=CAM_ASM_000872 /TAXON_ID= /ORGANISM="Pseudokeronopsis sp., Strain Brazil" /LENGTH=318 /DNA_ID=CAMNT_0049718905 /DNA_START=419 /DNA_END=1375 /DNA_ORIENTATION=-
MNQLEFKPSGGKRKFDVINEDDFDDDDDHSTDSLKKACNRSRPLTALSALSSNCVEVFDTSLEELTNRVNAFVDSLNVCFTDFDESIYKWNVNYMASYGTASFCIQIFEGIGSSNLLVDMIFVEGQKNVFDDVARDYFDRVQNLSAMHLSSELDTATLCTLYLTTATKKQLSNISSILFRSVKDSNIQDMDKLNALTDLCGILTTCRHVSAMKVLYDVCQLPKALNCTVKWMHGKDLKSATTCQLWILAYALRCLLMLTEIDTKYVQEIDKSNARSLKSYISQFPSENKSNRYANMNHNLKFVDNYAQSLSYGPIAVL